MILYEVRCSHKMRSKASVVRHGSDIRSFFFFKKNEDKVSLQVSSHGQLFRPAIIGPRQHCIANKMAHGFQYEKHLNLSGKMGYFNFSNSSVSSSSSSLCPHIYMDCMFMVSGIAITRKTNIFCLPYFEN